MSISRTGYVLVVSCCMFFCYNHEYILCFCNTCAYDNQNVFIIIITMHFVSWAVFITIDIGINIKCRVFKI